MDETSPGADPAPLESLPRSAWFDGLLSAWLTALLVVFVGLRLVGSATFQRLLNSPG
jgi:hypothetical protein